MNFTIIDDRDLNLEKRGYQWADKSQRILDVDYWNRQQTLHDENIDNAIDSFTDGAYPICKGDDGKLYTVMFRADTHEDGTYWYRPVIWEQIEKAPRMTWWNDSSIEIVKIDGELYALNGWNGEKWLHCWKCIDRFTADPDDREYEVAPVYELQPYSEDEDFVPEIIGYEVA